MERKSDAGVNMRDGGAIMPEAEAFGDTYLSLIEEQAEVCQRIARTADGQRGLISGDDPSALVALLADRQKLTNRLGVLSGRVGMMQARWRELREVVPEAQRRRAEGLARRIAETLRDVMERDEEDVQRLRVRKLEAERELSDVSRERGALDAYRREEYGAGGTSEMTDQQA